MKVHGLAVLLLAGTGLAASAPEQVHVSLGVTNDVLTVEWVTQQDGGSSIIEWGETTSLGQKGAGDSRAFTQDQGRTWYTHVAAMTGLKENTRYYYKVGDSVNGMSATFNVMNKRKPAPGQPYKHILFGDMGASCAFTLCEACTQSSYHCDAAVCATNRTNVGLIAETDADMFLHVGDFAYNLDTSDGTVGDYFFRNIEQVAAYTPYMISHGNHEDGATALAHFMENFRLMPSNAIPPLYTTTNGATTNSMYFSWDHGLVHYIAMSTELWFGITDGNTTLDTFIAWVKDDLDKANKNRANVPWIVMHGHRSIYCSCDGDCHDDAYTVRETMEPILFDYGVDFFINGHEHNYERMWPTYQNMSDQSNMDPKATIYVVTGAAGSPEMHEPFTYPQPSWSAFRSNSFCYTRMYVYNATHIHWQQVQTDPTEFPGSDYGRVIDDTWIVQHNHGPFNATLAPKAKPTSCPEGLCQSHDHWRPLLGLDDGSGRPTHALIAEFREKHGDDAWREKLAGLLKTVQGKGTRWEDVREDGNSDGAWAYPKGYSWRHGRS
eukprot:TRINITY_DN47_c0_g4_i3.p2 TRINITY_DN47_c0_g4~~TRINITY_DN47_c0_g4_i3.p2  ORF type:complete len:549 (+),score=228.56 TRINITY_DN47_c0_g4_i3:39-1685(+)